MSSEVDEMNTGTLGATGGWNPEQQILQQAQNDSEPKFEGKFARATGKKGTGGPATVDPFKKM
jgi:hypothetical protein